MSFHILWNSALNTTEVKYTKTSTLTCRETARIVSQASSELYIDTSNLLEHLLISLFWGDGTVNEVYSQEHRDCAQRKRKHLEECLLWSTRASSPRRSSSILDYFPSIHEVHFYGNSSPFQSFIARNYFSSQHGIFLIIFNLKYFVFKMGTFVLTCTNIGLNG